MLEELIIHNYALIDRVNVKFTKGFNVLTGETGAGKSILIGALGLLLGKKADKTSIRSGSEEAMISGIIDLTGNEEAVKWLDAHNIRYEDNAVILRRVVKQSGRDSISIHSTPVSRADLTEFSSCVFDMHGQHDNQSLLFTENHRKLLDRFGNTENDAFRFFNLFRELTQQRDRYNKLLNSEKERAREISLLEFAIKEIDEANMKAGELEKIENEQKILANHEKLYTLIDAVYSDASGSSHSVLTNMRRVKEAMEQIVQIDKSLSNLNTQLQDSFYEMEDFVESIRHYRSSIDYDPDRLDVCDSRIAKIRSLFKKYGNSEEEVLSYRDTCEKELESIQNWDVEKQSLRQKISELEGEIRNLASSLSKSRKSAALQLQEKVETELKQLGMPKVKFQVQVALKLNEKKQPVYTPYGIDQIEFLISPNLGEPYKNLNKIVSGGEMSRIMLALKSVLSEADQTMSLIFDEIDAGIGGEIAISVGEKLKELSRLKQILCITHLATIAVRADNHVKVEKIITDNRTLTRVKSIKGHIVETEISRMLSGDKKDEVSLKHARELIKKYGISGVK
ncbi:MAG: DNA repair protein RecN [Spirochaetales bacterium]|nr:DNA repair protein RecN [Spirochaetales bacterium]